MKRARKKTASKRSPKTARRLGRRDGCEVCLRMVERAGSSKDAMERTVTLATQVPGQSRIVHGKASKTPKSLPMASSAAFAALGHPIRAKMLLALLESPGTYRALQKATKLAAGPLYHHVNQLRLAGLIAPKQRDLYELTRGGRNLALLAIVGTPLLNDTRPRPGTR